MALGFCFRGHNRQLWEGTLPYDEIEGEHTIRFAQFSRFLSGLGTWKNKPVVKDLSFIGRVGSPVWPMNFSTRPTPHCWTVGK
jgi:hypothetical protein